MAAPIPASEFAAGDGGAIVYRLNGVDYSTGHTLVQQVRQKPTLAASAPASSLIATPELDVEYDDENDVTIVTASLTDDDTRAIALAAPSGKNEAVAWTDLQVTPTGGHPRTIIQHRIVVTGDVSK